MGDQFLYQTLRQTLFSGLLGTICLSGTVGCGKFAAKPAGLENKAIFGSLTQDPTHSNNSGGTTGTDGSKSDELPPQPPADTPQNFTVPLYRVYSVMAPSYGKPIHARNANGLGYRVYKLSQVGSGFRLDEQELGDQDYIQNQVQLLMKSRVELPTTELKDGKYIFLLCSGDKMDSAGCSVTHDATANSFSFGMDVVGPWLWRTDYSMGRFSANEVPAFEVKNHRATALNMNQIKAAVWGRDTAASSVVYSGLPLYFDKGEISYGPPSGGGAAPAPKGEGQEETPAPGPTCPLEDPTCGQESPLILDLANDLGQARVELSSRANGVDFDIRNDGTKVRISWPLNPEKDMFLTLPKNGRVESAEQLFGNQTRGADGKLEANGFLALSEYASADHPEVLDSRDAIFSELRLWADLNRDGVSAPHELFTLSQMGVKAIHLDYVVMNAEDIYGNTSRQRSFVEMVDSGLRMIFDIWFKID